MRELIIARPDAGIDLRLYSVERILPLILRFYRLSPPLTEVVEAAGECLEEIKNNYGCEYLALLPVERDGMAYLPLHARKVMAVHPAPFVFDHQAAYSNWNPNQTSIEPGSSYTIRGRQWVADQIGPFNCWRYSQLERIAAWPGSTHLAYRRTEHGIFIPHYKSGIENTGFIRYVLVVYDAQLTDERGYPLVSDKDATAAAHYWMHQKTQADAFAGIKNALQLLPLAEANMNRSIAQARIGDGINQNGWDLIMRAGASWDRVTWRDGLHTPALGDMARGAGQGHMADGY